MLLDRLKGVRRIAPTLPDNHSASTRMTINEFGDIKHLVKQNKVAIKLRIVLLHFSSEDAALLPEGSPPLVESICLQAALTN